jgi:uncharacterized membrane protein
MCPQLIDMAIGRDKRKMKKPTVITLTDITAILVAAIQLAHNESLEFPFVFTAEERGRKKLEFKLFKGNITNESYRDLHLLMDIK